MWWWGVVVEVGLLGAGSVFGRGGLGGRGTRGGGVRGEGWGGGDGTLGGQVCWARQEGPKAGMGPPPFQLCPGWAEGRMTLDRDGDRC